MVLGSHEGDVLLKYSEGPVKMIPVFKPEEGASEAASKVLKNYLF
jgi:hypothetical protein